MSLSRMTALAGGATLLAILTLPEIGVAQDCEGKKPRGGTWATSAELYLQKARENPRPEEKQRRYHQALDVLFEGFEKQPDNPRNYELAGRAFAGLGDYAGADSVWTKAESMWTCYSGTIDTLRYNAWVRAFNSGVQYSNAGDTEKALASYEEAYQVYKELPQPLLQMGALFANEAIAAADAEAQQAAQDKAIEAYRRALQIMEDPSDRLRDSERQEYSRAATFNMAQMLAFQDRFEEAAEAYDAFLKEDPENVDALTNAAVVLTRAAQQADSEAEALEEGAQKTALLEEAEVFRSKAKDYYAKLTARDDLTADEYHNVGLGLNTIGMNEEAASAFTKALDVQPYRPGSLAQLAFAMFSLQNYDSLRVVASKLVERYPLNKNNLALLANAYRELEQPEKALEVLEKHEVMAVEIQDLSIAAGEGTYTLTGYIHNISMEPGAQLELQFDFHADDGEVVASETAGITLPETGAEAQFTVTTESAAAISGVTYRRAGMAEQPTGSG